MNVAHLLESLEFAKGRRGRHKKINRSPVETPNGKWSYIIWNNQERKNHPQKLQVEQIPSTSSSGSLDSLRGKPVSVNFGSGCHNMIFHWELCSWLGLLVSTHPRHENSWNISVNCGGIPMAGSHRIPELIIPRTLCAASLRTWRRILGGTSLEFHTRARFNVQYVCTMYMYQAWCTMYSVHAHVWSCMYVIYTIIYI